MTESIADPGVPVPQQPQQDAAAVILKLAISPTGQVHLESFPAEADLPSPAAAARISNAFAHGSGHGLLHLGAVELGTVLPSSPAFGRELAHLVMTRLCAVPDLAA